MERGVKKPAARKRAEHLAGWLAVRAVFGLAHALPGRWIQGVSVLLAWLAYFLGRRHRRVALENLRRVYGASRSEKDIRRLALRNYEHISLSFCEGVRWRRGKVRVSIEGRSHLERALSAGSGVVAVTGHIGNFGVLGACLAAEGYAFNLVFRDPDSPGVASRFNRLLGEQGVRAVPALPRGQCVAICLQRLRSNELVCILADQREGDAGVEVSFLGHRARAVAGPALLALRTGAAVVPMFIVREGRGAYRVEVLPALGYERRGSLKASVKTLTLGISRILEERILERPEQWWWVHRRWKD